MGGKGLVLIVGRPNVGKSSLFNRFVGKRVAVVDSVPGVTRDRIHALSQYEDVPFEVIDTGGIGISLPFGEEVKKQILRVLPSVSVVLFVVDAKEGLTSADEEVADWLRRIDKPVILVVNKVDNAKDEYNIGEFYALGFGEPIGVSASHGRNIDELLERIKLFMPQEEETASQQKEIVKVAIVGRPNVGKSSLFNLMVGDERAIVTDIPGTTRDAIDTLVRKDDKAFLLLDTAGLRRKSRKKSNVEYYSTQRTIDAIMNADVCLVVVDAFEGLTNQDKKIVALVEKANRSVVMVFNKWDLFDEDNAIRDRFVSLLRREIPYFSWVPVKFTSAVTGYGVSSLWSTIEDVYQSYTKRIPTSRLNIWLRDAIFSHAPQVVRGKRLKIYYVTQAEVKPPTIVFFVNDESLLVKSYENYLQNRLRYTFGFVGTPIIFRWKPKQRKDF